MKNLLILIIGCMSLLKTYNADGQAPASFNYQAIVRNNDGDIIQDQAIEIRFSIIQDSIMGAVIYEETHSVTTSQFGLIELSIGQGTVMSGDFSSIPWATTSLYLKTEIDLDRSRNWINLGTSLILSVPYALYAESSGTSFWQRNAPDIYYNEGAVSIGTQSVAGNSVLNVRDQVSVLDVANQPKAISGVYEDSSGYFVVRGKNGTRNVIAGSKQPGIYATGPANYQPNVGFLGVYDGNDSSIVKISGTTTSGSGMIRTFEPNGLPLVGVSRGAGVGGGWIGIYQQDGAKIAASLTAASATGGGWLGVFGENGNLNCAISNVQTFPNNGHIGVADPDGTFKVELFVDEFGQGVIQGDIKNLRMEYPGLPGKEIWYACIEGPEAAAYLRGSAKLEKGRAIISFPDHFKQVIADGSMTVMVTPCSAESKGLAVTDKSANGFIITELMQGNGSYEVDWEVKAVRKGYENYQVIRDTKELKVKIQTPVLE